MVRDFFQRMMFGRYGTDHLNYFLFLVCIVLYLVSWIINSTLLFYLSLVPFCWAVFRTFSRNITARQTENDRFLGLFRPITNWWHMKRTARNDPENCYFKCPCCGQYLRVPKGRGRLRITCRNCGNTFEKTT